MDTLVPSTHFHEPSLATSVKPIHMYFFNWFAKALFITRHKRFKKLLEWNSGKYILSCSYEAAHLFFSAVDDQQVGAFLQTVIPALIPVFLGGRNLVDASTEIHPFLSGRKQTTQIHTLFSLSCALQPSPTRPGIQQGFPSKLVHIALTPDSSRVGEKTRLDWPRLRRPVLQKDPGSRILPRLLRRLFKLALSLVRFFRLAAESKKGQETDTGPLYENV